MEMFISTAFVPGLALLLDYLFNFIIRRRINISYAFLNYYSTYFSYWFSLINFAMLDRPIVATPNYKSDTLNVRKPKVRKLVLCRSCGQIWLMFIKLMEIVFHTFCHLSTINTVTSSCQHQTSALQRITRRTPPQLINTCLRVQNTSTHNYTTKKKLSPLQNKKNAQRL